LQRLKGRPPLFYLSVFLPKPFEEGLSEVARDNAKAVAAKLIREGPFRDLANSNFHRWFNGISCTRCRPRRADQAKKK
jgi:hypothetical protein